MKNEEITLQEKENRIIAAEKFLVTNSITNLPELETLEEELAQKKTGLSKLPMNIRRVEQDPLELGIDDFSKSLANKIEKMREQIKELKMQDYTDAKLNRTRLSNELLQINTKIG